jgi:mannose/fructose/N-acetylgalactosamine-specific phosphotransferase system component IIB
MICACRIDERLIHGQIIATWLKTLRITHLVVANNEAANDSMLQNTLKMVLPKEVKCLIKGVEDAIRILQDPRCKDMNILLIVGNPRDAYRLACELPEITEINLANYGSITKPDVKNKITVSKMVYLDEDDAEATNKLISMGKTIFTQKTPSDPKKIISGV